MVEKEPLPGFIGVDSAARMLGVSRPTFRRLAAERGLQVRTTPLDRRMKLVAIGDVERLREPQQPIATVPLGNGGRQ